MSIFKNLCLESHKYYAILRFMANYQYEERGVNYKIGKAIHSWRPQYKVILSLVKRNSKVLDVGCGDGTLGEFLIRDKDCQVWGVDLDPVGVAEAKRRGYKSSVLNADDGLPFKNKSFDVVVICGLLELLRKPDFVIAEALRVSDSVIVSFSNFGFWIYRLELLFGKFPSFALFGHAWWETTQTTFFTLADFLNLPSVQNAKVESITCIDWKNKEVSNLAKLNPNLFGRNCIIKISKETKRKKASLKGN